MTSNVIDASNEKHTIQPYRFKVLRQQGEQSFAPPLEEESAPEPPVIDVASGEKVLEKAIEETPLPPAPEPAPEPVAQPSFIEELLKRTEAANDNLIKLQMKIESQENEFKERLAKETAQAKEDGIKEGQEQAKTAYDAKIAEIESKYTSTLKKLADESSELENLLNKAEEQLSHTAIDIAKEVLLKELDENSAKVAHAIASSLIAELKDASKIEIKVNSADLEYLSEHLKGVNIKLSGDDAIAKGGALVLSDIRNIDGTIKTRFEKIKKILSE